MSCVCHVKTIVEALQDPCISCQEGEAKDGAQTRSESGMCWCADACGQFLRQQPGLHHEQHLWHACAPRGLPRVRQHPPLHVAVSTDEASIEACLSI